MTLVDTSAWVEFFRGRGELGEWLDRALEADDVALCGPVILELRRGLRSRAERAKVIPLLEGCHLLAQPAMLWEEAGELGYFLARRSVTVGSMDLLIATYALSYSLPLLTGDADFTRMKRAGLPLHLVEAG